MKAKFIDWGLIDYKEAWERQQLIFDSIIQSKKGLSKGISNHIFFCEHPHVYTLGKNGNLNNLLIQEDFLKKINATYYHTDRGGDITYHGPGQLVGYPIVDIEEIGISLKEYIFIIEEAIINTVAKFQLSASRLKGATGVWLDVGKTSERKICAIGVKASRYVTMHGFAFNVNTDLNYFSYINPCGFINKGVTSLATELNCLIDFENVKKTLKNELYKHLNIEQI